MANSGKLVRLRRRIGPGTERMQPTFDGPALLAAWIEALAAAGAAQRTIAGYRRDLVAFLDTLPSTGAPPTAAMAAAFRDRLLAAGRAPAGVARALSAVKSFCRSLADRGAAIDPDLYAVSISVSARPRRSPIPAEAADQALALAQHLSDDPRLALRDAAVFSLLFEAGLSIGEALSLTAAAAVHDGPVPVARGSRLRTVVLAPEVRAKLRAYAAAGPPAPCSAAPLFAGARGKPLDAGVVQRQMRRLRSILNLPPDTTTEALRQAVAARLREQGLGWAELQTRFGHRHPGSVRRSIARR